MRNHIWLSRNWIIGVLRHNIKTESEHIWVLENTLFWLKFYGILNPTTAPISYFYCCLSETKKTRWRYLGNISSETLFNWRKFTGFLVFDEFWIRWQNLRNKTDICWWNLLIYFLYFSLFLGFFPVYIMCKGIA